MHIYLSFAFDFGMFGVNELYYSMLLKGFWSLWKPLWGSYVETFVLDPCYLDLQNVNPSKYTTQHFEHHNAIFIK